jgi:hypothetical protein
MDLWTLGEALSPWWLEFVFGCWGFVDLVGSRWVSWIFVGLSI